MKDLSDFLNDSANTHANTQEGFTYIQSFNQKSPEGGPVIDRDAELWERAREGKGRPAGRQRSPLGPEARGRPLGL